MIPSRPLSLVDIIGETFSIYGRSFARYALLFLVLIVPGTVCLTIGSTELAHDGIVAARHDINFSDSDVTALRNDFNALLTARDPALPLKLPGAGKAYPHASTRQLYYFLSTNVERFSSPLSLFLAGLVLLVLGIFALVAAEIDLASQVFEERKQEFWGSLAASFGRHVWKILLLYVMYLIVMWTLDAILLVLPGQAGDALSGFVTISQIYFVVRFSLAGPALVSEELGPFQALRRSWQLTQRSGWRIFGATFVLGVIIFVVLMIASIIGSFAFGNLFSWSNDFMTKDVLTLDWLLQSLPGVLRSAAVASSILYLLLLGLLPVFGTVLYYDLRTRHDGPLVYLDGPG